MIKKNSLVIIIPFTALTASVILWGGSFVAMRIALRSLDPAAVMGARMSAAFLVILPFAGKLWPRQYIKGDWKLLIPMVFFQPCLYFLLESNALLLTTSTQAGVISASVPVLVTLGAFLFLSEKIGKGTIVGLVLSVAGVIVLTLSQRADSSASNPVLGNMMEVGAMIFAAANMLIIKKLSGRYNPWTLTAMQTFAGLIFFFPGIISLFTIDSTLWTNELILILLFLGILVSLGAFGLYNWGMSRISASKASTFINLIPLMAIVTGWIILGERLTGLQSMAALIIITGVLLSQYSGRRSRS
jgi:drug/metabolite transporter (DMT)-like permease